MTLIDVCEPFFQFTCTLNRSARLDKAASFTQVRSRIEHLLNDELPERAAKHSARLKDQYSKIRLVLIFFVDSVISESKLPFASQWHSKRLAYEFKEMAGDDKFFEVLEETMLDTSEDANERLTIFYTCIGLGFTGSYFGRDQELRRLQEQLSLRIRSYIDFPNKDQLTPQAYEFTDTRTLTQNAGFRLAGVVIVLVIFIVTLFIGNIMLFRWTSSDLDTALDSLATHKSPADIVPEPEPEPPAAVAPAPVPVAPAPLAPAVPAAPAAPAPSLTVPPLQPSIPITPTAPVAPTPGGTP